MWDNLKNKAGIQKSWESTGQSVQKLLNIPMTMKYKTSLKKSGVMAQTRSGLTHGYTRPDRCRKWQYLKAKGKNCNEAWLKSKSCLRFVITNTPTKFRANPIGDLSRNVWKLQWVKGGWTSGCTMSTITILTWGKEQLSYIYTAFSIIALFKLISASAGIQRNYITIHHESCMCNKYQHSMKGMGAFHPTYGFIQDVFACNTHMSQHQSWSVSVRCTSHKFGSLDPYH